MSNWRVGRQVPLNVYEGERPVCQCHNPEDAARIVAAMNGGENVFAKALDTLLTSGERGVFSGCVRCGMHPNAYTGATNAARCPVCNRWVSGNFYTPDR